MSYAVVAHLAIETGPPTTNCSTDSFHYHKHSLNLYTSGLCSALGQYFTSLINYLIYIPWCKDVFSLRWLQKGLKPFAVQSNSGNHIPTQKNLQNIQFQGPTHLTESNNNLKKQPKLVHLFSLFQLQILNLAFALPQTNSNNQFVWKKSISYSDLQTPQKRSS